MNKINIRFEYYDATTKSNNIVNVEADINEDLVHTAHDNDIPLEGACGCSLACSTCHVILENEHYNEDEISEEEDALLDCAFGRKPTSRLGCQIKLSQQHDNMLVKIPKVNKNYL